MDLKGESCGIARLIASLIAVYEKNWSFAGIEGIGWVRAGFIWLYNSSFYITLDFREFFICYALSGQAWDLVIEQRIAFTRQKAFAKEQRQLQQAHAQRKLHRLQSPDTKMFTEQTCSNEIIISLEKQKAGLKLLGRENFIPSKVMRSRRSD